MNRFEAAVKTAECAALESLDFSMFAERDIAQIALQRPEVMQDVRGHEEAIRAWLRRDDGPMLHIAHRYRLELVTRALAFVYMDYRELRPILQKLQPAKVADIGCGYGMFDLFLHAEFGSELVLIDIEETEDRHLKFRETGAGTADLMVARRFLVANGCDRTRIVTVNPAVHDPMDHGGVDLAISLLSCGYLYPCDEYRDFFLQSVRPGGMILLDIRTRRAHQALPGLAGLGRMRRLGTADDGEAMRMLLQTHGASDSWAA